jgi:arylsulfatase A-like enzyme
MVDRTPPVIPREPFGRAVARALSFGGLAGALVGALESAKLLIQGAPRYFDWAVGTVALGVAGYAVLGLLLALLCAPIAWILWRPPTHCAAPPGVCAGLGVLLGLIAFVATEQIGAALLVPAAIGGTLACVALRELIAWSPRVHRERTYVSFLLLALMIGIGLFALRGGRGAAPVSASRVTAPGAHPNVVLVTVDTLRADHLGCYGAASAKTPNIDALALESAQFLDTTSQANTTGPSHTSMLTGVYPAVHGALHNGVPISNRVRALPELLADAGYATAAFVSGFTLKQEACGLAPRFQRYDDELIAWHWMPEVAAHLRLFKVAIQIANTRGCRPLRADRPAQETVDGAIAWLDSRRKDQPFFLWVHCYDPHAPYTPPPPFDRMHDPDYPKDPNVNWYTLSTRERKALVADEREVTHMRALYAGEISYTDAQLGRLFDHLRNAQLWKDSIVILTSDHGEGLGEHGYYFDHGTFLYDTELHVPLLVHVPGGAGAGARIAGQTRLLDLAPTVLDALQMPIPEGWSGSSLVPLIRAQLPPQDRPSFGHGELSGELSGYELDGRKLSLRNKHHKLIWTSDYWLDSVRVPEKLELYDLESDPLEQRDLWPPAEGSKALADEMRARLDAWRQACESIYLRSSERLSAEVEAQLRLLGYL